MAFLESNSYLTKNKNEVIKSLRQNLSNQEFLLLFVDICETFCEQLISCRVNSDTKQYTLDYIRYSVDETIDEWMKIKVLPENKLNRAQRDLLLNYKVQEDGENSYCLVKILNKTSNLDYKKITPIKRIFDILTRIVNDVQNFDETEIMMQIEHLPYLIQKEYVYIYLSLCNRSSKVPEFIKISQQHKLHFKHVCFGITELNQRDDEFRILLFYVDNVSGYILMRPIASYDESEISCELLKIFSDFGVPKLIYSQNSLWKEYLERRIINIRTIWPAHHTSLQVSSKFDVCNIYKSRVKANIDEWMKINNTTQWAMGSRILQHQLNTLKVGGESSYEKLFGLTPNPCPFID